MAMYRKRPVVIEAEQFFPPGEFKQDDVTFLYGDLPSPVVRDGDNYYVETLEGRMRIHRGDWLITGVAGEHYPCRNDIFVKTYELVE